MPATVLAVLAAWRARYGIDFGDSSHAVTLALRMSQGDLPFRDEMNLQVLGAWPAVPFVWAWTHVVGLDGLVLASRVWFVLCCVLLGSVAWRALSPTFGRGTSAAAVVVALVPAAYNQQVVSYNTTPALMYLAAAATGTAAVVRRSPGWGALAGVTAVLGAVSHPVTTPASLVLLVVLFALARGRARTGLVAGAIAVLLLVATVAVLLWGIPAVRDTISFTNAYQATRPPLSARLDHWLAYAAAALTLPWTVMAVGLGLLAAVPQLRRAPGARPVLLVAAVAVAGVAAFRAMANVPTVTLVSWLSVTLGAVLLVVLLPSAVVCGVRRRGRVSRLLAIGLTPTLVGTPFVAAYTSSSPMWGAAGATLAPGLLAVTLAALVWVERDGRVAKAALAGAMLVALAAVHSLNSFRDGPPGNLGATVPSGAFAGLVTSAQKRDAIAADERALATCAPPGAGMLDVGVPSAFLFGDVRFATPLVWLDAYGPPNARVVGWIARTGRAPDCVVASRAAWLGHGQPAEAARDPLRDWVLVHYRQVDESEGLVLLRRTL